MAEAEANSRRNRKPGPGIDALVNAARLGVLEKELGIKMRRHRDPGNVSSNPFSKTKEEGQDKDETVVVMRGF